MTCPSLIYTKINGVKSLKMTDGTCTIAVCNLTHMRDLQGHCSVQTVLHSGDPEAVPSMCGLLEAAETFIPCE